MAPKPAGGGGAGAGGKDAQPAWIRLLPIFHCALIAVAVVLAAFRFFVLDSTDRYKCHALLNSGDWLDAGLSSPTALKNWQPDGCILHSYSAKTSKPCLSGRRVLFIGDSTARQVFYAAAQLLDSSLVIPDFYSPAQQQQPPQGATATQAREKHKDVSILASGTQFEFYWDPFLNGTKSSELIASTNIRRPGSAGVNADAAAGGTAARAQQAPAMVVFGSGLWFLRNPGDSGGARGWMRAVDRIFDATQNTRASQMADEVVLLPVETTITSKLTPDRQITLTPAAEAEMNAYLRSRLPPFTDSSISQLSIPYVFNEMTSPSTVLEPAGIAGLGKAAAAKYLDLATQHTPDGMHFDAAITKTQANILLNLRCNDVLPKKFTFDKTCCNQYPAPNWVQGIVILIVLIWGPLGTHYIASRGNPVYSNFFPPPQYLMALTVFGFSIIFMYFSDRTSLFLKIQKQFDFWQFTIAMLASLVLGLVTLKKPEKDLGFLNRDQTDEWKGWMQIAILVYHYYGASKVSGIYNPIRVLVAAYLFMSGYGHFFFYYKKGDYGFARVAGVLVRLNLLTIVLVYVQDTDYLSYYFSPLVTLWFGIIWVTMYVGHQYNKRVFFVGGKIIVSAILAKLFHWFPQPLQLTFGLFNSVFRTQWNAKEWSFRVTLDQWIVYVGMLAALVFIKVQEEKLWERAWWDRVKKGSIAASGLAMVWFFHFELARDKFAYNTWHPYVSCVPVLAFIVLRNCTPTLRSTSSRAFIWIGQCSLETFICQFHIWLAGDTKGLLVLLPYPRLRFLNMIFTSAVFLFLSHTIARTTGELTEWILAAPPKRGQASLPTVASSAGPSSSSNGGTAYIPLSTLNGGDDDAGGEYRGSGGAGAGSSHHPSLARWNQLMTNLKFRCAVFMALIWVINLLYPSEHPMQGHLLPTH